MIHIIPEYASCIIYEKSDCEIIFGWFDLRTRAGDPTKSLERHHLSRNGHQN